MTSLEKAKAIVKVLDEKKGRDIQLLEIRGLSTLGDYFILASGGSNTQVKALSDDVDEEMHKQFDIHPECVEGLQAAEWVLMDYDDVMVHIFQEEPRAFYNLERLWNDAPRIDISDLLIED